MGWLLLTTTMVINAPPVQLYCVEMGLPCHIVIQEGSTVIRVRIMYPMGIIIVVVQVMRMMTHHVPRPLAPFHLGLHYPTLAMEEQVTAVQFPPPQHVMQETMLILLVPIAYLVLLEHTSPLL
jgi:hypothetical protein